MSGRQWPAESPTKKTPPSVAGSQLVGDPVPLVLVRLLAEVLGEQDGRVLDVEAWVERADPDPQLVARGEGPSVPGGHVAAVDPELHLLAAAAGVDLQPSRERGVGRLVAVAVGEDAPPPERVDDEAGGEDAAVGLDRDLTV